MALHAIRLLCAHLPQCQGGAMDTLLTTKTACVMASLASFGGLGLNTATCHHVGGLYNVPHGEANAILLPHTMRYNLEACAERQRLIAEAMGVATPSMSDAEAGLAAADAVDALCRALALPRTLREVMRPRRAWWPLPPPPCTTAVSAPTPSRSPTLAPLWPCYGRRTNQWC